jgi:hypothetical protein
MRIIDTLSTTDAAVTVVDVRAGLMSPTLHALRDIGFLDAVKKGQITFVVFHILGSSIASLNEIEETSPFTTDAEYFLVKNFINNTNFFEWDQATHASYFKKLKDAVVIEIPKLNEMAYEQVELASVPFLTFVANKDSKAETANYSFVLRGYVRHWLGNVWAEYDRVKLLDLFEAATERRRRGPGRRPIVIGVERGVGRLGVDFRFFHRSWKTAVERFAISFYCRSSRTGRSLARRSSRSSTSSPRVTRVSGKHCSPAY